VSPCVARVTLRNAGLAGVPLSQQRPDLTLGSLEPTQSRNVVPSHEAPVDPIPTVREAFHDGVHARLKLQSHSPSSDGLRAGCAESVLLMRPERPG
jgi:hypothetical protein